MLSGKDQVAVGATEYWKGLWSMCYCGIRYRTGSSVCSESSIWPAEFHTIDALEWSHRWLAMSSFMCSLVLSVVCETSIKHRFCYIVDFLNRVNLCFIQVLLYPGLPVFITPGECESCPLQDIGDALKYISSVTEFYAKGENKPKQSKGRQVK